MYSFIHFKKVIVYDRKNFKKEIPLVPKLGGTPQDVPPLTLYSLSLLAMFVTHICQVLALYGSIRPFSAWPKFLL